MGEEPSGGVLGHGNAIGDRSHHLVMRAETKGMAASFWPFPIKT